MKIKILKGFTLIELIIILLIGGILFAIAGPLMFDLGSLNSNAFINNTKFGLNYAQRYAISKRTDVFINISSSNIKICKTIDCSVLLKINGQSLSYDVPSGYSLSVNPNIASFSYNYLGEPSTSQQLRITLNGRNVFVEQGTGTVHE